MTLRTDAASKRNSGHLWVLLDDDGEKPTLPDILK